MLAACATSTVHAAGTVHIAAAANFAAAMKRLAPLFEQSTDSRLVISHGATGQLYAQIRHGAPFDLLLAADATTPARLLAEGLAVPDTAFVYARGRLVLWSADPRLVDAAGRVLRESDHRIAVANPRTAPYGQAAAATLEALGLLAALQPRLVTGESIAQTYQFVASGNAPLGFIALAQLTALPPEPRGSHWLVPAALHPPIDQAAVLLRRGDGNSAARAFLAFLRSPEAVAIIRELGYEAGD